MWGARFVEGSWRGQRCYRYAAAGVELTVLSRGGKLVSLRSGEGGREWLGQPVGSGFPAVSHGDTFESAEMCGWDEMAPTIVATRLGHRDLPDHGEVWSVPWAGGIDEDMLRQSVCGRQLPFELRRSISGLPPNGVRIDYEVTALGIDPVWLLWAAHPQFAARPGDVIRLDAAVEECVVSHGPSTPSPLTGPAFAQLAPGAYRKRWLRLSGQEARVGIAGSYGGDVELAWSVPELPFLGIWEDRAAIAPNPVIALEPSNGWYDDLAAAASTGRCLRLVSGTTERWSLTVRLLAGSDA
jgi:hypothetical protein